MSELGKLLHMVSNLAVDQFKEELRIKVYGSTAQLLWQVVYEFKEELTNEDPSGHTAADLRCTLVEDNRSSDPEKYTRLSATPAAPQ
eukprot:4287710-Amphidinium_carterae.1